MVFTSVAGHLMELDFTAQHKRWRSCNPVELYQAPVVKAVPDVSAALVWHVEHCRCSWSVQPPPQQQQHREVSLIFSVVLHLPACVARQDKSDLKQHLQELARQCQWLILWLDCDREGENISFEVSWARWAAWQLHTAQQLLRAHHTRLVQLTSAEAVHLMLLHVKLPICLPAPPVPCHCQVIEVCTGANRNMRVMRARFSALIPRELQRAMQQLVAPNAADAAAVDARQEIDLRVGASFTRLQTLLLQVRGSSSQALTQAAVALRAVQTVRFDGKSSTNAKF
jgi:DNA topoisomerase-3